MSTARFSGGAISTGDSLMSDFEKEVIERLSGIESDIKQIRDDLKEDYKILHGNGHPGLIHRVTVLETNQKAKENHVGIIAGVIGFVINAIIALFAVLKR